MFKYNFLVTVTFGFSLMLSASPSASDNWRSMSSVENDIQRFQDYFLRRHANTVRHEFGDGVYAIDAEARESWEVIEQFPPYGPAIEKGEWMWHQPFANGKSYLHCFPSYLSAQRENFPYWDKQQEMVITLPLAINQCRAANDETPLIYEKGEITNLLAYISYESRGQKISVEVPEDNPAALAAYRSGKQFFFARRGQLNFSCAHCHAQNSGELVRFSMLSPALGHTTHWPAYRVKWGELGTLHRRFGDCSKMVRAKPFPAQSEEYRNLEFFLSTMSNGLEFNGPSVRQ